MKRFCIAALLLAGCASHIPGYELESCPGSDCLCSVPGWSDGVRPVRPTAEKVRAAREALNLTDAQIISHWLENKTGKVVLGIVEAKRSYEAELRWNGKAFENPDMMFEMVCVT